MTLIVNIFGSPGSGKSTCATGVFHKMKMEGYSIEYVHEYAKGVVWEKSFAKLNNQLYIFGQQHHRQFRCADQVDILITDSPLILGMVYAEEYGNLSEPLADLMRHEFRNQNNLNVVLKRNHEYDTTGRVQDEKGALHLDKKIISLLDAGGHSYYSYETGDDLCDNVVALLKREVDK